MIFQTLVCFQNTLLTVRVCRFSHRFSTPFRISSAIVSRRAVDQATMTGIRHRPATEKNVEFAMSQEKHASAYSSAIGSQEFIDLKKVMTRDRTNMAAKPKPSVNSPKRTETTSEDIQSIVSS